MSIRTILVYECFALMNVLLPYFNLILEPALFTVNPSKRIYWLYLLTSLLLVLLVLNKENNKHALNLLFSPSTWLSRSSYLDFFWLFSNHIFRALIVLPLLGGQVAFALELNHFLSTYLGSGNWLEWNALSVSIIFTLTLFFVDDFSRFYLHYLHHKISWLWHFHAIHHSADKLTPVTLYRIHTVEMILASIRSLVVVGSLSGIFIYIFDSKIDLIDIMGVSIGNFLFNLVGANLRHSSIWLGFGYFEKYFISPAQHQIHHSIKTQHLDKNFGSILSIWDRLFSSAVYSKGETVEIYGLKNPKSEHQGLSKQLLGIR